jgi:hypothetical protein
MLSQIIRLWPSLHPHARRAVVMYASTLWVEESYVDAPARKASGKLR